MHRFERSAFALAACVSLLGCATHEEDTRSASSGIVRDFLSIKARFLFDGFVRHANGIGRVDDIYGTSSDLAKADATWSFVPGLAGTGSGGTCVSIESRNYRNFFLRHQNGQVALQPFQDTRQYREDATFCRVPGLADGAQTSFRAFQFPNAYLRHALGVLRLDDDRGEETFRKDATFEIRGPWLTGKFFNPILGSGADPTMAYDNGRFYLVTSEGNAIVLRQSSSIEQLEDAAPKVLWRAPGCPAPACAAIWAPELQKIDGRWWIYFAGENGGGNASHRMFVLRGGSDPAGTYESLGELRLPGNEWAIDGVHLSHGGQNYYLWSGWLGGDPNVQHIFIARMTSPSTVTGDRVRISSPTAPWETIPNGSPNVRVNEGPQPIHGPNGRLSVTLSVNGSWTNDYCLGLLTLNGDPMRPGDWSKSSSCIFSGRDTATAPGHNGFLDVNGRPWLAYHALIQPGSGWGGRSIRVQPMAFNGDGTPSLGVPVNIHDPIAVP